MRDVTNEIEWLLQYRDKKEYKVWVVKNIDEEKTVFKAFENRWKRMTSQGRRLVKIAYVARRIVSRMAHIIVVREGESTRLHNVMKLEPVEVITGVSEVEHRIEPEPEIEPEIEEVIEEE